ncbi:MFS transporter [Nocardia cyriacigeorgica]|uniref:Chloramphenicol resistance protein n=2 Tax=Nocardia cyriacigeorgica TaxID=135487 RepID=H6R1E3_NOCCG|nr:Cmx/CmrA family chloramphenicol efflux MFS transporter [Nocardia cyriacigeorgica]NEW34180.1 MFS transporter [Nocardia cyriacigeorgica]BDU08594.1 chloramphenicol resistance protein [Nocardia cyriacigeorgica]CCF65522.1 Chloramphenicol resistance protein [Nocardia cyriacigeorgica GUH-2]
MPLVVFVLAAAVFVQGTSEFMLSGLLEPIAGDLDVPIGSAGLLTSLFAVGMIIGAPVMAVTAGRWPVRYSLAGFLALFLTVHIVGALTSDFGVLLGTRLVAAVANAGFLAVALAALPALVGADRVGRATSLILSGVTLACIAGVPAGAVLGSTFGWQSAFWAVVLAGTPILAATWSLVPGQQQRANSAERPRVRDELRALRQPAVRLVMLVGALVNAATFAGFTYLAVVATDIGGAGQAWVPVVLALFGIGSFVGVSTAGRYADRHSRVVIGAGTAVLPLIWIVTALTARVLPVLLVLTVIVGAVSFAVGSTLIGRIVTAAAPAAPLLNGAFATTAFNIGAAGGPAVAGVVIAISGSVVAALWASAALAAIAAIVIALSWRRAEDRVPLTVPTP